MRACNPKNKNTKACAVGAAAGLYKMHSNAGGAPLGGTPGHQYNTRHMTQGLRPGGLGRQLPENCACALSGPSGCGGSTTTEAVENSATP